MRCLYGNPILVWKHRQSILKVNVALQAFSAGGRRVGVVEQTPAQMAMANMCF